MVKMKTLAAVVSAGVLALGIVGCPKNHSEYDYNGKIGEDKVVFEENSMSLGLSWDVNKLTVVKPSGRTMIYGDNWSEDLKLDYVKIIEGDTSAVYSDNTQVGKSILKGAQKKFDAYLQQIKEIKAQRDADEIKQRLEDLN